MSDGSDYFIYGGLCLFFLFFLMKWISFSKAKREKLYLFDLSSEPVKLKRLGYIMQEIKPETRNFRVKKGIFSNYQEYQIEGSLWNLKVDFKNAYEKRNQFIIIGKLEVETVKINENTPNEKIKINTKIKCILTNTQLNKIIQSQSVLSTLNELADSVLDIKLQEFKNSTQSTIIALQKLGKIQDVVMNNTQNYNSGVLDYLTIFKDTHGLDDDEVNVDVLEEILEQNEIKDIKRQLLKGKIENLKNLDHNTDNGNGKKAEINNENIKRKIWKKKGDYS